MNARRSAAQELDALAGRPLDADGHRGGFVIPHPLERGVQARRYLVPAERRDAFDLRPVGDRHDARDERDANADATGALDEGEVVGVVVEELGDDDVDAGVDLLPQVLDVELEVATLGMTLRMPAADQAEAVPSLAHEADHVDGVAEAVGRPAECRVLRHVAPDRDDVLDAATDHQVAMCRDLLATRLDARHVGRGFDAERADARYQLDRRPARLRAGARDRDEARAERLQRLDRPHERRLAGRRSGGEELEGDDGAAAPVELPDLHAGSGTARVKATSSSSSRAPSPSGTSGNRSRSPSP